MNNPIDVHILHLPNENQYWWELCQESLKNHPINIHNCDGIPNDTNEARRIAYRKGTAPYVSFVDPDDIVISGAFQKCLDVLEQNPEICGVYTMTETVDIEGNVIEHFSSHPFREWYPGIMKTNLLELHQLCVMRRSYVQKFYDEVYYKIPKCNVYENIMLFVYLGTFAPWKAIDILGYQWRKRPDGTHLGHGLDITNMKYAHQHVMEVLNSH